MNDAAFFGMLRAWTAEHAHGSVTTEDFAAFAAGRLGPQVTALADAWLYQPRLPDLPVS